MSTLVALPVPSVFDTVPLIEDAVEIFEQNQVIDHLKNIGDIFVRHNVFEDYGLTMLHRHFDILEQEILVESIRNDNELSLFVPWTISPEKKAAPTNNQLWSSYGMADSEKKYVIPQHWSLSSTGDLQPLEYLATDNKDLIKTPTTDFVSELFSALKELGVHQMVGLRSRGHFKGIPTWETTPENTRGSVVARGKRPENINEDQMVKVLWQFDKDGKLAPSDDWCLVCLFCGRCKNQN